MASCLIVCCESLEEVGVELVGGVDYEEGDAFCERVVFTVGCDCLDDDVALFVDCLDCLLFGAVGGVSVKGGIGYCYADFYDKLLYVLI